jgi:hypothetical protein
VTKFKNLAAGARGLRNVAGDLIMIEPGQTATLDVDKHELKDAEASRFFAIDGKKPAPLDDADEEAAEAGPLDLSVAKLKDHLATVEDLDELEQLGKDEAADKNRSGALDAIQARIDELKPAE